MRVNAKKLGRNIKNLRQRQGLSQEMLAIKAGLKLSNLAKLEGGFNANPTLETLVSLASVLSRGSLDRLVF